MSEEKTSALILAAGRSSRMEDFKPLLSLGGLTMIEQAILLFKSAGVPDILVVAGFQAGRLLPTLEKCGVDWIVNEDYDRGMYSSIQTGVRRLAGSCEAFFVLPADHPFVQQTTVLSLLKAFRGGKEKIYHPSCQGRRGHPPLIPAALIPAILDFDEPGGLRVLLSRYEELAVNLECDDPGILIDLDTKEQYAQAKEKRSTSP
ncbi:MAG: Nicotine blue oxidoreductase [Syntrophus sp. PtaU1.Bin208]|nr:MAG: Nicotine blue oxidoreductase [Syntrophus sp. PtaU1.Bin208]